MTLLSQRLSVNELTGRILDMAQSGVYRESVFEAFQPVATKRQIRSAIAQAKQFGLYSVPAMRDPELGTYYQVEAAKFQSFQKITAASLPLEPGEDLAERLLATTRVVKAMLAIAGLGCMILFVIGSLSLLQGQTHTGTWLWSGAALTGSIWAVQRAIAGRLL